MKIKLLVQDGGAALVEYRDSSGVHRVIVPRQNIVSDEADDSVLSAGIQHGDSWSSIVTISVTPDDVERELHKRGIWTWGDAVKDQRGAREAFLAAIEKDLQTFLQGIAQAA